MITLRRELPDRSVTESRMRESPQHRCAELRLWLRLLTCANLIETRIRRRLREEFDTTLPRFDLMAQLEPSPDGILLGELSRRMMVSNGNVTGLVDRLVQDGFIDRQVSETDRRAVRVRLTAIGRSVFATMAEAYGNWIAEILAELAPAEQEALWSQLGDLEASVRKANDSARPENIRTCRIISAGRDRRPRHRSGFGEEGDAP